MYETMRIMGIDLAGKMENPCGICILDGHDFILKTLYREEDILKEIKTVDPSLIVIDAPLSLPKGRCCLEKDCECAYGCHFRQAELDIRPYGRVLPLTFRGMKMLTLRGISIAEELKKRYEVIETHPRTSQKILGLENLLSDFRRFFKIPTDVTKHELDAVLAALTGFLYIKDCFIKLGDPDEGIIIIPKDKKCLELLNDIN